MSIIKATFRNGRIEPDEPLDLPDGTELQISLPENDDEPMSRAEIDRVLTAMDQIIPFDRSPAEEARLEADRQARKEWEKDHSFERAEKLRKMWE